jgi:hypothetical protein
VHYNPCRTNIQLKIPPPTSLRHPYCMGFLQPWAVQVGAGLPSARLGTGVVVRKTATAARIRKSFFTMELLCERIRTVVPCMR